MVWSAIAVTAANPQQAKAYGEELRFRQQEGLIPNETVVLALPDPASVRVGSGGATLNALVSIVEHLSARKGYSVIDFEAVRSERILVLHSGGDSQRIPHCSVSGKAFSSLPLVSEDGELWAPIDALIETLSTVCASSPPGLFVASSDVMLSLPEREWDWSQPGVTGLAIPANFDYGPRHGVYQLDPRSLRVRDFLHKQPLDSLHTLGAVRPDQTVLIDSGIVYFCSDTAEILLSCHVKPPLDACTYLGVDNGAVPVRFELYSDILLCMAENTVREDYLNLPTPDPRPDTVRRARNLLWEMLRPIPFRALIAESGRFIHLGTTDEYVAFVTGETSNSRDYGLTKHARSIIEQVDTVEQAVVVNSFLSDSGKARTDAVIENSDLRGEWHVGRRALCADIRSVSGLHICDGTVVQEIHLPPQEGGSEKFAFVVFGVKDQVKLSFDHPSATFTNRPWKALFERSGITPDEIWAETKTKDRSLWNAKLYPLHCDSSSVQSVLWLQDSETPPTEFIRQWREMRRVSLADLLSLADPKESFHWRRQLSFNIDFLRIKSSLTGRRDSCLLPLFERCVREGRWEVLDVLDEIACDAPPDIAGRAMAATADVLAAFAGPEAGLRSGPSRNPSWQQAFDLLEQGDVRNAVAALGEERRYWLKDRDFLMRAARHYEGAAQVLIRKSVETAPIRRQKCTPPPVGTWLIAETPARIDLAGGWTDTPPITYEHGGLVVNTAVSVDGRSPIGARVRRIDEPVLVFCQGDAGDRQICDSLSDLEDFAQPLAPGALLKAAVLCAGIVSLSSPLSLAKQLKKQGGGYEIHTRSVLPTGSGLGTSSILAGALLALLGECCGFRYDRSSLVHAVLRLEQMLTTGGGWQDQVGGLLPGIKRSWCPARVPVHVETEILELNDDFLSKLNQHIVLVYTGRARLARNLLQDVIRRWYARMPQTVQLADELVANAERMCEALTNSDLETVGTSLSRYYEQKKRMAGGVEPAVVSRILEVLHPHVHGAALTGAGGGGFMLVIAKEPNAKENLKALLTADMDFGRTSFHDVEIDRNGLVIQGRTESM